MIEERVKAVFRELQLNKNLIGVGFTLISLAFLAIGILIPKQYETTAVLYADLKNVIKPLLEGKATVTEIDQAQVAKEAINTRRFIEEVAREAGLLNDKQTKFEQARVLAEIQKDVEVLSKGANYIAISYTDSDPERAYNVVNELVTVFIRESKLAKKKESAEAYEFIEGQVREYKKQLKTAEDRLKEFHVGNRDGTQLSVDDRIAQLRTEIEKLKLDIDDAQTRKQSIQRQLAAEGKFVERRHKSEEVRTRLAEAKKRLDSLLLSYTETHPDVVSLNSQIDEMQESLRTNEVKGLSTLSPTRDSKGVLNPLYEELRKKLAEAEVDRKAAERRLRATEGLLEQEYDRLERIVSRKTELQELTRDYDVTKGIYEDLLSRKEKARMSMTLDAAGQGISYKVQEEPVFPLLPSGLRLIHFLFLGPIMGIAIPLGLLYVYIEADPRIRMASVIQDKMKLPLLAVIPHATTPIRKRMVRPDIIPLIAMGLCVLASYVVAAVLFMI